MKVYVVTAGEYGSYHVDAVFADKATAERYGALRHRKQPEHNTRVETWVVLEDVPWFHRRYTARCSVSLVDGSAGSVFDSMEELWEHETVDQPESRGARRAVSSVGPTGERGRLWVTAVAPTRKAARNTLQEAVAKVRAAAAGIA